MSKFQRRREAVLGIARKGAQVFGKALRLVPAALSVVNLLGNEEAASWLRAVLAAFVEMWEILSAWETEGSLPGKTLVQKVRKRRLGQGLLVTK